MHPLLTCLLGLSGSPSELLLGAFQMQPDLENVKKQHSRTDLIQEATWFCTQAACLHSKATPRPSPEGHERQPALDFDTKAVYTHTHIYIFIYLFVYLFIYLFIHLLFIYLCKLKLIRTCICMYILVYTHIF